MIYSQMANLFTSFVFEVYICVFNGLFLALVILYALFGKKRFYFDNPPFVDPTLGVGKLIFLDCKTLI